MLDDCLCWQRRCVRAGVSVCNQYGLKAQICSRTTGRIDAVLRLHPDNDQLADLCIGEPFCQSGAEKAVGSGFIEHCVDLRIDGDAGQKLRKRAARFYRRAVRASMSCSEYWCTCLAGSMDELVDIRKDSVPLIRFRGAVKQSLLHVDDQEGAASRTSAVHGVSPVMPMMDGETSRPRPLLAGPWGEYDISSSRTDLTTRHKRSWW